MNKLVKLSAAGLISAGLFTSCATKAYVDEQINPVKTKQAQLEQRLSNVEQQLATLKGDVQSNKDKISSLEAEHANIKAKLDDLESKVTNAQNTAEMADRKADKNAEDIAALQDELKRTNENIQNLIEKKMRK
jgi:chromosome segregation ATPase